MPILRAAGPADREALTAFARRTYTGAFGHTFSAADLDAHLEANLSADAVARFLNEDVVLLAEVEGHIVGFVQIGRAHRPADPQDRELRRLYVDPAFQNQGIGTVLINAALAHPATKPAGNLFLDVWEHNHGARRFYARHGFTVIGSRAFTVESGAPTSDDLIMMRPGSGVAPVK